MLCLAVITGAHASPPVPDRKVHASEHVMHAPTMATCVIDTVATPTYAVILKPALGPVAPAALLAVDGITEYLALIRSMTADSNRVFFAPVDKNRDAHCRKNNIPAPALRYQLTLADKAD
jgi:hypothetical protein